MDLLPAELKEHILAFLDARTLNTLIPAVCQEWAEIGERILRDRKARMRAALQDNPSLLEEIKARIPPPSSPTEGVSEAEEDGLWEGLEEQEVLEVYEKSWVGKTFRIGIKQMGDVCVEFFHKNQLAKGCDCRHPNLCIVRSVHFMPCLKLVIVQLPERIAFYSDSCFLEDGSSSEFSLYSTVIVGKVAGRDGSSNVWIDNNTHTAISVYRDKIVGQVTTRALILFRVVSVDHESKVVQLEHLRKIYLPLWSCGLLLIVDKLCALFTTGSVGVWRMKEDDIQVSSRTCVDIEVMRSMRYSKMYRAQNVVLVNVATGHSTHWAVFDPDRESETGDVELFRIDMNSLILQGFPAIEDNHFLLLDFYVSLNCVILFFKGKSVDERSWDRRSTSSNNFYKKVACFRLKQRLTVDIFQDPVLFCDCFHKEISVELVTDPTEFLTPVVNPHVDYIRANSQLIALFGLNDIPHRQKSKNCDSLLGKNVQVTKYFLTN